MPRGGAFFIFIILFLIRQLSFFQIPGVLIKLQMRELPLVANLLKLRVYLIQIFLPIRI